MQVACLGAPATTNLDCPDSLAVRIGSSRFKVSCDQGNRIFICVRKLQPLLNALIASAGGPFPSATEAVHGTWCGSEEAGRVAAAAVSL
jgi:hypothetical protein